MPILQCIYIEGKNVRKYETIIKTNGWYPNSLTLENMKGKFSKQQAIIFECDKWKNMEDYTEHESTK